jgi:adenine C2-methylase RlmN of 23S rRNA A2503 and tRNA A37
MSATVTIRNVPEGAHDEIGARAELAGQSLQEYLRRHLVALASKPDMKTLVAQIRERKERTGTNVSIETILRELDAIRR